MYIEQVIIDGFKSYATRTVIPDWDPEFNAITGLNGSGKSNILDAICFVLGITSLSHVRAQNLQDLVYKRGQAGINKASVTLVFNNSDRSVSPPGYEDQPTIHITRQVVVNGRNKYIVNGSTKNQQDVANLFQSVQLNVNNPHFLIMQGKITKVLNMKPPEILAMIEEAAGTRMFEDRKEKAFKTMEKKEAKLREIQSLLETEIGPKLDKLRESKRTWLEFQKIDSQISQLKRILVAYDYFRFSKRLTSSDKDLSLKEDRVQHLQKMNDFLNDEISEIDERISEIQAKKQEDGALSQELEVQSKEMSKQVVKAKTQHELKLATIRDEKKSLQTLQENREEATRNHAQAAQKLDSLSQQVESALEEHEEKKKHVAQLQELLQTLTTGMASSEGKECGYMDQLKDAQQAENNAISEAKQIKLKLAHLQKELKENTPKARAAEKTHQQLLLELESCKHLVAMMKREFETFDVDKAQVGVLTRRKSELEETLTDKDQMIAELEKRLAGLEFSYSDPTPNFDRSQVKGLVAELVSIPSEHHNAAVALEVCAGGKLYNVVVSSETVGGLLLEKGKLRRRVTIIPLNKIQAFQASVERIATAKKLAPGKVDLALHLIGSDDEVAAAMKYVFGMTLICKDANSAKTVTFDRGVQMRSVTHDGDIYDPSGQLSGGSKASNVGVLAKMQELKGLRKERDALQVEFDRISKQLDEMLQATELKDQVSQKIEMKLHEQKLLEERISTNPASQMIAHVQSLKEQIETLQRDYEQTMAMKEEAAAQRIKIQQEIKELEADRSGKLKSLEKEIAQGKKEIASYLPTAQKNQQRLDMLKEEVVQMQKEVEQLQEQIQVAEAHISELKQEEEKLEQEFTEIQGQFKALQERLKKERALWASSDEKLQGLFADKKMKTQSISDGKLEMQQLQHDIQTLKTEKEQAKVAVEQLDQEYPWIQDHVPRFGVSGSDYDFEKMSIPESRKSLKQLQDRHASLSKNVDRHVLDKFDRLEKHESSLKTMFSTVQRDKQKIQETIQQLDAYKREALIKTWRKVDVDFGAIFGDLLPGNTTKLVPPDNGDIMNGLEVRVCLGGVWKHSLTELSGGQRSLIALSLILSLLQFKPAPMYILDEVDAALDLSHTQHIGTLLKSRFKGSQFILVSLKDGMFHNANVLFRTKFVEGVSKVDRIDQRGHDVQNRRQTTSTNSNAAKKGSRQSHAVTRQPIQA